MKRLFLSGAALIAAFGGAHAADLPARYPVKAPPVAAPSWDWSGFYLGAYWGNSINQSSATTPAPVSIGGVGPGTVNINDGGWTGGGTAGLNWQFAPSWLVGIEGDFGKLGGTRLSGEFNDVPNLTTGTKDSWYATARGRFGYVTGPALIYVTGGAGWVHVTDTFGTSAAPTQSATTTSGAAIGGGIEVKLSRNWTAKTEYIYIDGGTHSFGSNSFANTGVPTTFTHNFQVIKSGLNYRFDGPWDGLPFFNGAMQATNHNWNGFYAGGNAGIGSSMIQGESTVQAHAGDNDLNGTGFNGGGTLGYNYMLWDKYLVGVEGDFNALKINHSATDWNDQGIVLTEKTSWFGTIRGRVGTSTGPALLYFTGGAAFVNFQDGAMNTLGGAGLAGIGQSAGSVTTKTSAGWTFGGGTEVAIDAHWSAKIESLFIDAGKSTHATFTVNSTAAPIQFKERFGIVRAGLNYAFN